MRPSDRRAYRLAPVSASRRRKAGLQKRAESHRLASAAGVRRNLGLEDPRQSCGSTIDSYGQPATFDSKPGGRPLCQWPIDRLEKVLNGRGRAWRQFSRNGGDDVLSPRWTCVAAGLGTVLTEGYLRGFYKRADSLVMHFDQSNWFRSVWTDGRAHPPASDSFYHGHSIGWMEGNTFVVETTNFTWDPDGYDDHSHMARSHMAKSSSDTRSKARTAWNCPSPSKIPSS